MKTALILVKILVLTFITIILSCDFYAPLAGCGSKREMEVDIAPENLNGDYYISEILGEYKWEVEVENICVKVHMPVIGIKWKIKDAMFDRVLSFKGIYEIYLSGSEMLNRNTQDAAAKTTEIVFTQEDVGLKQYFKDDEPGSMYITLKVKINSLGDEELDLEYIRANWISCRIYADYYEFE